MQYDQYSANSQTEAIYNTTMCIPKRVCIAVWVAAVVGEIRIHLTV